jgi:prevent-host-death family protein
MKTANLSDVKNDLSRFVDLVRRGERVRILVHGVPAADLVPVEAGGELGELERQGIVRRGTGGWAKELDEPGPRVPGDSAVAALLKDRAGR